ncbi:hypothetical protein NQ317_010680 [Molorchus minor]|uniref:Uncharacterized protein n=1 Tax=Molorchus minor TaxID=1323400 RepID=A0ABQ9K5R6_9CUCU|nr:hypothetical protein NQ317_010680 [Molorchus minor]
MDNMMQFLVMGTFFMPAIHVMKYLRELRLADCLSSTAGTTGFILNKKFQHIEVFLKGVVVVQMADITLPSEIWMSSGLSIDLYNGSMALNFISVNVLWVFCESTLINIYGFVCFAVLVLLPRACPP